MESSLSPREIQARIRAGATVEAVAAEAGVPVDRIEGFALPVVAEREHMASSARHASVRRRGNGTGHRRLGDVISDRLQARGIDADTVAWDAWRQPDLRWRVTATLDDGASPRIGEFVYDPKGRFSVTHNADASWMIGEQVPGSPDTENTLDFDDELAIVRAVQGPRDEAPTGTPGDDVPQPDSGYDESLQTSELDELYDLMSGISEDSVRIYVGLEDDADQEEEPSPGEGLDPESEEFSEDESSAEPEPVGVVIGVVEETHVEVVAIQPRQDVDKDDEAESETPLAAEPETAAVTEPEQDALIEDAQPEPVTKPRATRRRRAQVPSWDEIMFGGPTGK